MYRVIRHDTGDQMLKHPNTLLNAKCDAARCSEHYKDITFDVVDKNNKIVLSYINGSQRGNES